MDRYTTVIMTIIAVATSILALQSLGVHLERLAVPRSAVAANGCGNVYSPCQVPGLFFQSLVDGTGQQRAQPVYVVNGR